MVWAIAASDPRGGNLFLRPSVSKTERYRKGLPVTEQVELEEQLHQAQKMEAVGRLARGGDRPRF